MPGHDRDRGLPAVHQLRPDRRARSRCCTHCASKARPARRTSRTIRRSTNWSAALRANPQFKLRIESHRSRSAGGLVARVDGDERGARGCRRALADARKGIAVARLEAFGCGATRPLGADHGAQRAKNERIELYVTDPLPPSGMRSSLGCNAAELAAARTRSAEARRSAETRTGPRTRSAKADRGAEAGRGRRHPGRQHPRLPPRPRPAAAPAGGGLSSGTLLAASTTAAAVAAALAAEPQADRDKDGVANATDQCPLAPGKASAQGCPEFHRLDLEAGRDRAAQARAFPRRREPDSLAEPGLHRRSRGHAAREPGDEAADRGARGGRRQRRTRASR